VHLDGRLGNTNPWRALGLGWPNDREAVRFGHLEVGGLNASVSGRETDFHHGEKRSAASMGREDLISVTTILESPGFAHGFGSCGEAEVLHLAGVLTIDDEFREDSALGGIQPKSGSWIFVEPADVNDLQPGVGVEAGLSRIGGLSFRPLRK
jgi:hypothetical protein